MSRFSLRFKFGLLLVGFVLALGTMLLIAWDSTRNVTTDLADVREQEFPEFVEANFVAGRFDDIKQTLEYAAITGEESLLGQADKQRALADAHLGRLLAVSPPEARPEVEAVRADFAAYYPKARALAESSLTHQEGNQDWDQVNALSAEVGALRGRLEGRLDRLVKARQQQLGDSLVTTTEETREHSRTSFIIGVASAALLLILLVWVSRRIVIPLTALSELTREVALGRFDEKAEIPLLANDEVGDLAHSFRAMTRSLKETTVSKSYVDKIIHSMADTLLVIDENGMIQVANQAALNLLGYGAAELAGRSLGEICGEGWEIFQAWGGGVREKVEFINNVETAYQTKDGRRVPMMFSASVMRDDQGRVQGIVCAAQDITDRKRAEEELREAMAAAEAANQAKSTFLANMSHELRTPLNAILGYSEMLQEEAVDIGQDYLVTDLKKIHSAGKHLLNLINDVLDLSKIEAGKMTLYLETVDVRPLIDEVVSTVEPLVDRKANTLEIVADPELGTMHADVTKIRQTLFNLLSNACKFTENGLIRLSAHRQTREGRDWLTFSVKDSGIGMSPEQLSKLFQAFSQADASTTRKYGGTGLGLAISKRFCEMMGGDVTVESELGKGSTFIMRVPAQVVDPKAAPPPVEEEGPAAPPPATGGTVLVIDDDPTARDLLTRQLRKEGFGVATAAGGEEGLKMARDLRPLAITLDVNMPQMSGWTVLSELKADPAVAGIPVVVVSMVDEKTTSHQLGAAASLPKPVDHEKLLALLREFRDAAPRPS